VPATAELLELCVFSLEEEFARILIKKRVFFLFSMFIMLSQLTAWKSEKRLERRTRRPRDEEVINSKEGSAELNWL